MKLSTLLLSFLLVFYVLICGAYGARIGKFAMRSATSSSQRADNLENKDAVKNDDQSRLDSFFDKDVECDDNEDHCSSKGKNRKLITSATIMSTSTTKPIQEDLDYGGKKMSIKKDDKAQKMSSSSSSSLSFHHSIPSTAVELDKHKENFPPAEYENAMDMTVMDYSPAKKKPPIHN